MRDLFLKTEWPGGKPGAIVTVPLQFFVTKRHKVTVRME